MWGKKDVLLAVLGLRMEAGRIMGSRLILYLRVGEPRPMPPLMSEAVPIENPLYAECAVSSHVVDEETESGDSRSQTT